MSKALQRMRTLEALQSQLQLSAEDTIKGGVQATDLATFTALLTPVLRELRQLQECMHVLQAQRDGASDLLHKGAAAAHSGLARLQQVRVARNSERV